MTKIIQFTAESRSTGNNPSSLNSHPSTKKEPRSFAPSVQSDLFNYLKPGQKTTLRLYLRLIKRPYQEKLCISLMDYLEGNGLNPISEPVLRMLQSQIIEECQLRPLTSREPKSIGTVIRQFLAGFSGRVNSLILKFLINEKLTSN